MLSATRFACFTFAGVGKSGTFPVFSVSRRAGYGQAQAFCAPYRTMTHRRTQYAASYHHQPAFNRFPERDELGPSHLFLLLRGHRVPPSNIREPVTFLKRM